MKKYAINCRPIGALHDNSILTMKDTIMLYRSASLDIMPGALSYLSKNIGIDCHIDLRTPNEINVSRDQENIGVEKKVFSLNDPEQLIRKSTVFDSRLYGQSYINLIENNTKKIVDLLKFIVYSDHQHFIVSCYAGKDRTGIISVIILLMFDMPEWLIYVDYVMSTSYLVQNLDAFERNWKKRNITAEKYCNRFKVDPRGLEYMLGYFTNTQGGLMPFLKSNNLLEHDIFEFNRKFHKHKSALLSSNVV